MQTWSLVHYAFKDAVEKKLRPEQKKELLTYMIEEHFVSVRQACKEVGFPKSSYLYKAREKNDQPIIDQLTELIENHPLN